MEPLYTQQPIRIPSAPSRWRKAYAKLLQIFPDPQLEADYQEKMSNENRAWVAIAATLAGILFSLWGLWDLMAYPPPYNVEAITLRYAFVLPTYVFVFLCVTRENLHKHLQHAMALTSFMTYFYTLFIIAWFPGQVLVKESSGIVLITFFIYTASRLKFSYAAPLCVTALVSFAILILRAKGFETGSAINNIVAMVTANVIGFTICYLVENLSRKNFLNAHYLQRANAKVERLLHLTLPADIAKRLQDVEGRPHLADYFREATILFVDIVDFTILTERMSPELLVRSLDQIFTRFDEMTDEFGLEKVKTIGDAYMVVGGVPNPRADHAEAVIRLAFAIREMAKQTTFGDRPLGLRMGIHTGPLVAGVIGNKRFLYDLWGDAVNTASRMESSGVVGAIQITEATYRRVEHLFECASRGEIDVKGKGKMQTYLVIGEKSDNLPRDSAA